MSVRAINWAYGLFKQADIPPQERAVLLCLCWHHVDKTGGCFPSAETLAQLTGYRRQRVFEALAHLEAWGLIKRVKRRAEGHQASNSFRLFGALDRGTFSAKAESGRGDAGRVQKKGRWQSPDGGTLAGSPPVEHERGDTSQSAEGASQGGESQRLRIIAGGRHV